jgi:hypothetical protein
LQLVEALVLGPDEPPVVHIAVLQAGQDYLLGLVDGGHCWWRLERAGAGVLLSTPTLWVFFLAISVAIFSEVPFDSAATHIVVSWAILPVTMSLVATAAAAVRGHNDIVQALLVRGDAGHYLLAGVEELLDLLAVSRATACVTALVSTVVSKRTVAATSRTMKSCLIDL